MTTEEQLTEVFRLCEREEKDVRVLFSNGHNYELRIFSTMHAEAGGDVVAEVVRTIHAPGAPDWSVAAMNFHLSDVAQVESAGERLFPLRVA